MSKFNDFTAAFDEAIERKDIDGASTVMVDYVKAHSGATGQTLQESFDVVRAWMGYDMGGNRDAYTRHTPEGKQALAMVVTTLGCKPPGTY